MDDLGLDRVAAAAAAVLERTEPQAAGTEEAVAGEVVPEALLQAGSLHVEPRGRDQHSRRGEQQDGAFPEPRRRREQRQDQDQRGGPPEAARQAQQRIAEQGEHDLLPPSSRTLT
jgi:hypothetical protein